MEAKLLALLAIVATTAAGPIAIQESDECSTECNPSNKFNYVPQTTYLYDYRVDTITTMVGAAQDSARLTLQTRANIEVLSQCEFALTLSGSRLLHSDSTGSLVTAQRDQEVRRALESRPLRFSFQDGRVESVCNQQDNEPAWVMNIKKGVLSSFQNNMDDLAVSQNVSETDVSGTCNTEYTSVSNGYYTISVKKSKDILSCTERPSYNSFLQTVPYNVPSDIHNLPVLKSSQECSQDIENGGVLKKAVCTESHVFRPFSNGKSGGSTEVTQTLTYSTSRRGVSTRKAALSTRDSLVFDNSATKPDSRQARKDVEELLATICRTTDIEAESPRMFYELVQSAKQLSQRDLEDIHRLLKTKTLCPENIKTLKFYLDALPVISTPASVKLMASLINSGEVEGLEAKSWIASLAFVRAPESSMLADAKTLMDNEQVREDAILPVSAMVNNYCQGTSTCSQDYTVLSIIRSLERIIGSCSVNDKTFGNVLLALRGLGNAGHSTRATRVINTCMSNTDNPMEIRVAAAQAYRRIPCDAEDSLLWRMFEATSQDSELRIASYLALMRCPTERTLSRVAATLNSEEDEQVGSFVYSHLSNLKETSNPHKQEVARAVENLALDKEFDTNPMKFSRNLESSLLLNKINTGFSAESNLVWSSESNMPRSVSGNLTVELFGQSINLVDFGARMEGLETLIKNMFINSGNKKEIERRDEIEGSMYGRIFGNELMFLHSKTAQSPFKNLPNNYLELAIALADNHNYALTHSAQFLDLSLVVPTGAGLPVNVVVNGTATVDMVLSGKMDLRKAAAKPRSLNIDGEIRPSAAVEITGTMAVDAFVTKTGLRMRNTLHTSTGLKGRVQLDRGQVLNIELDTPERKIDVFSASSKFYILHNDMEQEQAMITENRKELKACSSQTMTSITGMELCGEISFPNASMVSDSPYYPLTGPSSASLTLYKRDTHSGYKFSVRREQGKKQSITHISFNTPGSRVDRNLLAEMDLNYDKQEVSASLLSPWKKAQFTGSLINEKSMKSISGNVLVDEKDTYGLTSEVKLTESKSKIQLSPMVELRRPGADNIQLIGFATVVKPYKSLDVDVSLSGVQDMPYTLKGSLTNNKKEKSFRGSYSADGKNEYSVLVQNVMNVMGKKLTIATLRSMFKVHTPERQLVAMTGSADYKEGKSLKMDGSMDVHKLFKKPATFKVSMTQLPKKTSNRYEFGANIKAASVSGGIDSYVVTKNSGFATSKATIDYTIPKVAKNKVILSGKVGVKSAKSHKRYTLKSNLNVKRNPEYNLDLDMKLDHKKKTTGGTVELKYGPDPKDKNKRFLLSSTLGRKVVSMKQAVITFNANALAPEHDIDVSVTGKHQHNRKMLDSSIGLNYGGKGNDVTAGVSIKDRSTKNQKKINGKIDLAYPGSQYLLRSDLLQKTPKEYEHVLSLKQPTGRHVITTSYKTPQAKAHDISSNIRLAGVRPITLSGAANLDPKNYATSGEVKLGKNVYGLSSSLTKGPRRSANLEIVYPSRKVVLAVDGSRSNGKGEGSIEASWDADNDKNQKITLSGSYLNKIKPTDMTVGGSLAFASPFENFEQLSGNVEYSNNEKKHNVNSKFIWGDNKQIASNMDIMRPVSIYNIDMNAEAKTPFEDYKRATLDVKHSITDKLNTVVKGTMGKESAKLNLDADIAPDMYRGNMALKTSSDLVRSLTMDVSHKSKDGRTASKVTMAHNGDRYGYDLNMDHSLNGFVMTNVGDLTVVIPQRKVSTDWQHKNTENSIQSTLKSEWAGKKLSVVVSGSHDLFDSNTLTGSVNVKTPWKVAKNVELAVNHKMSDGFLNSNAVYKKNNKPVASTAIKYTHDSNRADGSFKLSSPFHDDISAKAKCTYQKYPITGSAQVQWAKRSQVDVEGSLNAADLENADAELKISTPFKRYRNMVLKGTNTNENGVVVTHLTFDQGVGKDIDVESRIGLEGPSKLLRLKIQSPYDYFRSLDTGVGLNGDLWNFDSSADIEFFPYLGKYQGNLNMNYIGDDVQGKLRIETPLRDYPYFELSTSSVGDDKTDVRNSMVALEYYPRQLYKLNTVYRFDIPFKFEATVNSPFSEYNDIGLSLQHNHSPVSIASHADVTYQADKKIEADVTADWSGKMEGSVVVKTPFEGYEQNQISARHQGNTYAFASHAEANVAGKSVVADASYNGGYNTRGEFTLNTPIPGYESVEITLRKKGKSNNMNGGATFSLNNEKSEAKFNHRLRSDLLKSSVSFTSPYTENFKASVEHNGEMSNFNNQISVNYGKKYDVDSDVTLNYNTPDLKGNGELTYKLGGRRNTLRASLSKTGPIDDMTFSTTGSYNSDDVSVSGTWKALNGYDGTIVVKTPFEDFQTAGLIVSHASDSNSISSSMDANVNNKHVIGKLSTKMTGLANLRLSTELYTPFENLESTVLTANNQYDEYRGNMNGQVDLTTTIGQLGTGNIVYSKTGDLKNLAVDITAEANGLKLTTLRISNVANPREMHSLLNFNTVQTDPLTLKFDLLGDASNYNGKASARYGRNVVSGETSMKEVYNGFDADGSINYNIYNLGRNSASMNIVTRSQRDGFNTRVSGELGQDSASVYLSKSGTMDNMKVQCTLTQNRDTIDIEGSYKNREDLDVNIKVKTPFTDYSNVGMRLTQAGDLTNSVSTINVDYMDNKNINGKVELNINGVRRVIVNAELNTPFPSFEKQTVQINHNYNSYYMRLSGNIDVGTSYQDYDSASLKYDINGPLDNLNVDISSQALGESIANIKITNKVQGDQINSDLMVASAFNLPLNVAFEKQGNMEDATAKVTMGYNNEQIIVSGAFKNADVLSGSISVSTGMEGYRNIGASFVHKGNQQNFNTEAKINLMDGEQYSTKIDFYRDMLRRIQTTVEVGTPLPGYENMKFEYRHEGTETSYTCYSTLEYPGSKKITYNLVATTLPNPKLNVDITTPYENYEDLQLSASYKNNWPRLSGEGKLNAGNGNVIVITGDFDGTNDVVGNLAMTTPFEDFTDIGLNFQNTQSRSGVNANGQITYMDGKSIAGKIVMDISPKKRSVLLEMTTPFSGMELTKYESKFRVSNKKMTSSSSLLYGAGNVISEDWTVIFTPNPSVSYVLKTPFSGYEELKASSSFLASDAKYEVKGLLSAGPDKTLSAEGDLDMSKELSADLTIQTPFEGFTKVGASFSHKGNEQKFSTDAILNYMDGQTIRGNIEFYRYLWKRVVASAELNTPFSGMEKTKIDANFEDQTNKITSTVGLEYNNGKKINANLKYTYSPNYDVLITLNTPSYEYPTVRVQGSLDMTAPSYAMTSSLNLGYNKVYSANGKLNLYSPKNADGSADLTTPTLGYNKVDYRYNVNYPRADGMISLSYDNGKVISADLQTALNPSFDSSLLIKTPFYGYETLKGSAKFDSSYNQYESSSSMTLGNGQVYSMTSNLDYSEEPIKASVKVNTPFSNYRTVEASISHEGSLKNFKSTGSFSSPLTKNVDGQVIFQFESLEDMSLDATLKSALPNMDDLSLELSTGENSGERRGKVALGWTSGQEIVAEGMYNRQSGWYEDKIQTEFSLSTPIEAINNMYIKLDHSGKRQSGEQKIQLELNGAPLLNAETEYTTKDKYQGSLTVSDPWPMEYTARLSNDASEADILLNWNRDDINSNVHLLSTISDKSSDYGISHGIDYVVDISMERASRKVGLYNQVVVSGLNVNSQGKFYWDSDDSSKVSYDLTLTDNSRRRKTVLDGIVKLGLPSRTLAVAGSYSDNSVNSAADATFSWDADRDDSKQIGLKATKVSGDPIKGEVTLIMPAIGKEISVSGEVMAKSGRVIFDTKTDISYSSDARKTLTLTSRLEDISDYSSNYNYSLALGLKHPETNVDIQMSSHLGSSDEKLTMGLNADYLTARRQNKNLALLAEINSLKRLISLQVSSPINNMEVVGEVVSTSPYKLRLLNRVDGEEAFRSDLTVDSNKKTLVVNTMMGNEALILGAKYPNSTAFRADVTHYHDGVSSQEALFAARLNTSRLLHTRLSWNPDMIAELRSLLLTKVAIGGANLKEEMDVINKAIADELTAKYNAIAQSSLSELRPVLLMLEREMYEVSALLRQLSASLRELYENNDFYVQDMGEEVIAAYMRLQELLNNLNREYVSASIRAVREISQTMKDMTSYPLGEHYTEMVKELGDYIEKCVSDCIMSLSSTLSQLDAALKDYRESLKDISQSTMDSLYNNSYVNGVTNTIKNIPPYMASFEMPEEYTNAIYNVRNSINTNLNSLLDTPEIAYVKGGVNEVYQQGVWAYNYWQVEENIHRHLVSIVESIKEIIKDEIQRNVQLNPITVLLPGEIQMDIPLPIDINRLDSLEDIEPLIEEAENWLRENMPDKSTYKKAMKKLNNMMKSPKVKKVDKLQKDLDEFEPRPSYKVRKQGRRNPRWNRQ